jgi:Helix-turn-helix domain
MSLTSTGASKLGRQYAYRVNDAALISGLCRSQLYNLMRDGRLPFVEVGKIRMITDAALRKLLKIEESADA